MKYIKWIKKFAVFALLAIAAYILFFICLFLYSILFDKEKCNDAGFSSTIIVRNMNYQPKTGKLYYYEKGTNFGKQTSSKSALTILPKSYGVDFVFYQGELLSIKNDYRLVVDDTICFDLSDYEIACDTVSRTMGGCWIIDYKLIEYKCNGKVCYETLEYFPSCIDPPFEQRRIIEKGIYDK